MTENIENTNAENTTGTTTTIPTAKTFTQITYSDVASYLRLTELTTDDIGTLVQLMAIATEYIKGWTGRTDTQLDDYNDFVIALLVLVQDMWDNRTLYVDSANLNHVVSSILDMHSVNLL